MNAQKPREQLLYEAFHFFNRFDVPKWEEQPDDIKAVWKRIEDQYWHSLASAGFLKLAELHT